MKPKLPMKKIIVSLGLAVGSGVAVILGSLYTLQGIFGVINDVGYVLLGFAILSAISYVALSVRMFSKSLSSAMNRLWRNFLVALSAGFLFTMATSGSYSNAPFYEFWSYLRFLMTGILLLWFCVAFVIVTVFALDYSRKVGNVRPPKPLAKST